MKHFFGILLIGVIVFISGFILASVTSMGGTVAASVPEPRTVDGEVVLQDRTPQAQSDLSIAAAGTYFRTYGSYEFHPAVSTLTYSPSAGGMYAVVVPTGGPSFKCALDLPNGARINKIDFYVIDNSDAADMELSLYRIQPSAGTGQTELAWKTTVGLASSTNVKTISISGSPVTTIDNMNYVYNLRYGPTIAGSQHMIVGAQVQYTLPTMTYLPSVVK